MIYYQLQASVVLFSRHICLPDEAVVKDDLSMKFYVSTVLRFLLLALK